MAQRHLDDEVLWHGKVFGWKNGICPIKNPLNACQFSTAIFCNICVHYEKPSHTWDACRFHNNNDDSI